MKWKEIFKITGVPVLLASLCCLSPVILVLLGVGTVSFASSLADTLYGSYRWIFRGVGLLALLLALIWHFRKQGVCTLDQVKRERNRIINTVLLTIISGILGYLFFLYVVVEYIGKWLHIWR